MCRKGCGAVLSMLLSALEGGEGRGRLRWIYDQYHARMERVAMGILREQSDAEDAVQNAFIQIIRHFEKIDEIPRDRLPFWIISIVKNESLMILRKKRRLVPLEDWDSFAAEAEDTAGYRELVELFARLPETYRAALEMKILLGYTNQEVAEALGISQTAASTRVSRGRELLQKIAEEEGFHP